MIPFLLPVLGGFVALAAISVLIDEITALENANREAELKAYLQKVEKEKKEVFVKLVNAKHKLGPKAQAILKEMMNRYNK